MKTKTTLVLLALSVIAIASLTPTASAACYWNDRPGSVVWTIETASDGEIDFKDNPDGVCTVSVHGIP